LHRFDTIQQYDGRTDAQAMAKTRETLGPMLLRVENVEKIKKTSPNVKKGSKNKNKKALLTQKGTRVRNACLKTQREQNLSSPIPATDIGYDAFT